MYIFVHLLATNVLPLTSQGMSVWVERALSGLSFLRGVSLALWFQLGPFVCCGPFNWTSVGCCAWISGFPLGPYFTTTPSSSLFKATCMSDPQITISLPDFEALTAAVAELARMVQRIEKSQPCALDFPGWEGTLDPYLPLRAKVHWWCVSYH